MGAPHIRAYRIEDLDSLYEICVRTGAAGADASDLVGDKTLFGSIWAAPYATFEPEHCYVVDNGTGRAVGYVLATVDAVEFERRCEEQWWPGLRLKHPVNPGGDRLDDLLIGLIHDRVQPRVDLHDDYPSELHIDLLPVAQGQGWGRRLLEALFDGLRGAGSSGVHLGVSAANERAVAFYRHIGFRELDFDGVTRTFTMNL